MAAADAAHPVPPSTHDSLSIPKWKVAFDRLHQLIDTVMNQLPEFDTTEHNAYKKESVQSLARHLLVVVRTTRR